MQLTRDKYGSVAMAITAAERMGEDEAIDFLTSMVRESNDEMTRRMINHQLVRLLQNADRHHLAREVLENLILGED